MSDGEFIGPIEVDLKPKHKLALMVRLTSVYNARLHICFLHGCNLFTCNYMKIMSKCLLYREQVCVCVCEIWKEKTGVKFGRVGVSVSVHPD